MDQTEKKLAEWLAQRMDNWRARALAQAMLTQSNCPVVVTLKQAEQ